MAWQPISMFIASKVGAAFPFVGREELLDSLRREIKEDYKTHVQIVEELLKNSNTRFGDKLISLKFCYGAPGIGKMRSLYELVQNILTSSKSSTTVTTVNWLTGHEQIRFRKSRNGTRYLFTFTNGFSITIVCPKNRFRADLLYKFF